MRVNGRVPVTLAALVSWPSSAAGVATAVPSSSRVRTRHDGLEAPEEARDGMQHLLASNVRKTAHHSRSKAWFPNFTEGSDPELE